MVPTRFAFFIAIAFYSTVANAQKDEEETQAVAIAKRFVAILEKNPQRGTALEKVFSHHLQRGTLENFVGELKDRTTANTDDGVAWMLLGLVESRRRMDSQAIDAFAKAERLRTDDALPAYYRGQSLLRIGEPTQAIEAFEIAISRNPSRIIQLEIFEQLGRTHQRLNQSAQAIEVWKRFESQFPGDSRVLEQIASILNQEGAYADALPRYEKLILATKDAYQRMQYRIEAAQIRIRLGANAKGMTELETILGDLKPDGWLYREVQRKIEEAYLKSSDQAGLISYYETRLEKSPDDVESMVRLCKFLLSSGRITEANRWMTRAIERAPSRIDLRKTFIDQLIADQQLTAATEQFSQLAQLDPKNGDVLRDWGKTVLRDPALSVDEARSRASAIWKKSLESRLDDALAHVQVADLHQSAQMPDVARQLFQRATELAPDDAQYHEYFGEFLFQQNQREEAFTEWNSIAEGARRNANSVMRLAEIYDHAKQVDIAARLAAEACTLAPQDSSMYVRAARFQRKANQIDGSLESLALADKFADSEDQREFILLERMAILESSNRLKPAIQTLQTQLRQDKNSQFAQWSLLARYLAYQKRWKDANVAVMEALKLDEHNPKLLVLSSEIAEGLGNAEQAIQSLRKLADLDRRKRQDYLERIAKLRVRQKKWPEAIETAMEVVQASPSRIESYEFLSQICGQAKKPEQAIEALRKAMRIDPDSSRLTMAIGSALAENNKVDEAIELYWQVFAKAPTLDEKIDLTLKLDKLYDKQGRTAKNLKGISPLIDRLEAGRKDPAQRRDLSICLAQLYLSTSDFDEAKRTLEELLTDRSRDTSLLQRLARICVAANNLEMAIDYQRQLIAIVPSNENESYLASLLRQHGDLLESDEIVARLLQNETDWKAALHSLDGLLRRGDFELVLKTLEPMLRKDSGNWELLYRLGLAHAGVDQWSKAAEAFETLLSLDGEGPAVFTRTVKSQPLTMQSNKQSPNELSVGDTLKMIELPELTDVALGRERISSNAFHVGNGTKGSPEGFGAVRIAAIAWLVCCDNYITSEKSKWIREVLAQAEGNPSRLQLMDALAISRFRQDIESQVSFGTELATGGDPDLQAYFLELLRRRQVSGVAEENPNKKPLTGSQLDLMLEAYTATLEDAFPLPVQSKPNFNSTAAMLSQMQAIANASPRGSITTTVNGQTITVTNSSINPTTFSSLMTQSVMTLPGAMPSTGFSGKSGNEGFVRTVVSELRFAGQPERAESFLLTQSEAAESEFQLASLCEYLLISQRFSEIERPLMRWFELHKQQKELDAQAPMTVISSSTPTTVGPPTDLLVRLLASWGEQTPKEFSLRMLDATLAASNVRFTNRLLPALTTNLLAQNTLRVGGGQAFPNQAMSPFQYCCKSFVTDEEQKVLAAAKMALGGIDSGSGWLEYLQRRVAESAPEVKPLEQLRLALFTEEINGNGNRQIALQALKELGKRVDCTMHAAVALLAYGDYQSSFALAESLEPQSPQDTLIRKLILFHAATSMQDKAKTLTSWAALENEKLDSITVQSLVPAIQKANALGVRNAQKLMQRGTARQTATAPQRQPAMSAEALRAQQMMDFHKKGNRIEAIKLARQLVSKPIVYSPAVPQYPNANANANFAQRAQTIQTLQAQNAILSRSSAARTGSTSGGSGTSGPSGMGMGGMGMGGMGMGGMGMGGMGSNPIASAAMSRALAWEVLKNLGELETLIVETEKRLAASPNSFALLELLAEYYEVAGKQDLAEQTFVQALQVRPSASPLRIHFATGLASAEPSKACDQILALIHCDLKSALTMLPVFAHWFESCGRTDDLRVAIQGSNFRTLASPERYLQIGKQIMAMKNGFEIGATILEKLVETEPSLRSQALMFGYGGVVSPYPRLMSFSVSALLPNENEAMLDPWFGLRVAVILESNEALFEKLLSCHRREDIVEKLEPAIKKSVDRMPNWVAGQMMLALIAAKTDRPNEAKSRFESIARIKRLQVGLPGDIAWRLANEFTSIPEARATAIALSETLLASNRFNNVALEQRPIILLTKLLIADGQRAKAIEVLTREHESGVHTKTTSNYQAFLNSAAGRSDPVKIPMLADQLLSLQLPVESFRIFDLVTSTERRRQMELLTQRRGLFTSREDGMRAASQYLESMPAEKAIFELLQDRSNPAGNRPALELMFQVPLAKNTTDQPMESALQKTLTRHALGGKLADIEQSLQKLAAIHPADVSILATQAVLRLATGQGDAVAALHDLENALLKQDEAIAKFSLLLEAPVRNLPYEERKFAEMILATWLVARQCYQAKQHVDMADRLANRAFQCALFLDRYYKLSQDRSEILDASASNQPPSETVREPEIANILLFEWGRTQLQAGQAEAGLAKWQELVNALGLASTKNPPVQVIELTNDVRSKPSWTQNQFEWLIRMANLAVDLNQVGFSKKIARTIVAYPLPAEYTSLRKANTSKLKNLELDPWHAIQAIDALLDRYSQDESGATLRYELLMPIVLPGERRVCIFPNAMAPLTLLDEPPHCIAEKLIAYAFQCNRIDDLKEALENREPALNQKVMLTQIAIAEKDFVKSNKLLKEIDRQLDSTKMPEALVSACQVAIPAFQDPELREAALPILDKLLAEVKRSNRTAESEFKLYPLVREFDAYLRKRNQLPPK